MLTKIVNLREPSFRSLLPITHPLHEVDDLLLGGVAGEEVVDVLDDVHADVAHEVPRLLGGGPGRGGEAEHGEGELVHGGGHGGHGVQLRRGDVPCRGGAQLLYAVLTPHILISRAQYKVPVNFAVFIFTSILDLEILSSKILRINLIMDYCIS